MKRKALRVRSEGSIPPYVTEAESQKQHRDSLLCNSLLLWVLPFCHSVGEVDLLDAGCLSIKGCAEQFTSPLAVQPRELVHHPPAALSAPYVYHVA